MERTTSYVDSWPRQPSPVPSGDRFAPVPRQWVVVAAVWLLGAWTRDAAQGWRAELVTGTAAGRSEQQWPEPPALEAVGRAGGFGEPGPVAATVLTSLVQPSEGRPYEPTRPGDEVVAEVAGLLAARIPAVDERTGGLLRMLAERLAVPYEDLLLVETGADGLHLLHRDHDGRTLRLTVTAAPAVEQPPVLAGDGPDAALRTRLACVMTLLSRLLWVDNNNPVTLRAWIGSRADGDAADWWRRTRDEEPDEVPALLPLTEAELRRAMDHVLRGSLLELIQEDDWDGEWPEVPPGHIAAHLCDDLLGSLLARVPDAEISYTGYLPLHGPDDEPEEYRNATVVLTGATDVCVLDVDLLS